MCFPCSFPTIESCIWLLLEMRCRARRPLGLKHYVLSNIRVDILDAFLLRNFRASRDQRCYLFTAGIIPVLAPCRHTKQGGISATF